MILLVIAALVVAIGFAAAVALLLRRRRPGSQLVHQPPLHRALPRVANQSFESAVMAPILLGLDQVRDLRVRLADAEQRLAGAFGDLTAELDALEARVAANTSEPAAGQAGKFALYNLRIDLDHLRGDISDLWTMAFPPRAAEAPAPMERVGEPGRPEDRAPLPWLPSSRAAA